MGAGVDSLAQNSHNLRKKSYLRHYRMEEGFGQDINMLLAPRVITYGSKLPEVMPVDVIVPKSQSNMVKWLKLAMKLCQYVFICLIKYAFATLQGGVCFGYEINNCTERCQMPLNDQKQCPWVSQ